MNTDPIRLTDAADAVAVIAEPCARQHHGVIAYGELSVGQAYLVDAELAEHLLTNKGFAKVPAKKTAAKPTTETPKE